jgi:Flp pilus assembly protein TadD
VKQEPKSWDSHYNLGVALLEKGDRKRSVRELRLVTANQPNLLNARNALGAALQELGELDAAQEQFRAALKIDPASLDGTDAHGSETLHGLGRGGCRPTTA